MMSLLKELKRRNVFRAGGAYVVVAWLIIQVIETVFPAFGFDDSVIRIAVIVLTIGLLPVLVLAWAFELTPEGLKHESKVDYTAPAFKRFGKLMDRMVVVALVLTLGFFAFDKFVLDPAEDESIAETARQEGRTEALVESYGDQSIAVLAFDDMSAEGDQQYLSDGIAEELLNLLAQIPELRVISRSSAFSFKGKDIALPAIAKQLNVAHILEGSVRRSGNRIRITAQLIDAPADTHIWSHTFEREMGDVFAIQDEIAGAIVEQLSLTLLEPVAALPETDPETYTLYLRALSAARISTVESQTEALDLLQRAVVLDPKYANTWSLLGSIYLGNNIFRLIPLDEGATLARQAALTALELDPANGRAHALMIALFMMVDRDMAAAARGVEVAFASGRVDIETRISAAKVAMYIGQLDLAIRIMEDAISRDPLIADYHDQLGMFYWNANRIQDAKISAQTAIRLNPAIIRTRGLLATLLLLEGNYEAAMVEAEKEPWTELGLTVKTILYYAMGETVKSDQTLETLEQLLETQDGFSSFLILHAYVFRGEKELAVSWLEKNAGALSVGILGEISRETMFAELLLEPRVQAVMNEHGVSPEQLASIKLNLKLEP